MKVDGLLEVPVLLRWYSVLRDKGSRPGVCGRAAEWCLWKHSRLRCGRTKEAVVNSVLL